MIQEENKLKENTLRIIKGSLLAIIMSVIFLAVFATILAYTNVSESTILPTIIVIVSISILAGSFLCSRKIKQNGILNGAIVGLVYMLALYIISSAIVMDFSLTFDSFIMIGAGILAGIVGGIIGVNIKNN